MIGQSKPRNKIYENAIKVMLDDSGEERPIYSIMVNSGSEEYEWIDRVERYADKTDQDIGDVIELIVTSVIDKKGEPVIAYKESIGLDSIQ